MSQWQQKLCCTRRTWHPSWKLFQGWHDPVPWLPPWPWQGWWEAELLLQEDVVSPCVFTPSAPPPPPHSAAPHRPWETSKTSFSCPDIWRSHLSPFVIWQIFL